MTGGFPPKEKSLFDDENIQQEEEEEEEDDETYEFSRQDKAIVEATKELLSKIIHSEIITPTQLSAVKKVFNIFDNLPAISDELNSSVHLSGPTRKYGEHEISHWWEVLIEGDIIEISSGGGFYRKSTGGDSFSCLDWHAEPGLSTDYVDNWDCHEIVDDAQPYEQEVAQIDLTDTNEDYSLSVMEEGEYVTDDDSEEDEDGEIEESNDNADSPDNDLLGQDTKASELVVNLWAYIDKAAGMVYAISGKTYAMSGTDDNKLALLKQLATFDYITVKKQALPKNFVVDVGDKKLEGFTTPAVVGQNVCQVFEVVLRALEAQLPPIENFFTFQKTPRTISKEPLYVLTFLMEDDGGNVTPLTNKK